jgi:hypothetical protein
VQQRIYAHRAINISYMPCKHMIWALWYSVLLRSSNGQLHACNGQLASLDSAVLVDRYMPKILKDAVAFDGTYA